MDPERVHGVAMGAADATLGSPLGRLAESHFTVDDPRLRVRAFGLDFPNPVGLAAGFDKNARHMLALSRLGFGHIEVGTITGEPQSGNPRPRLFRLRQDEAILNRMGFNNDGSQAIAARLARRRARCIVGANIGKTKVVPADEAVADYEKSYRRVWPHVDYIVVNVSSPNTPGLRDLQSRGPLMQILGRLQSVNAELADQGQSARKPLLVKIAPDLTFSAIDEVLDVVEECGIDGVVATNTTISREGLVTRHVDELGSGGVSGAPVRTRALEVVSHIHEKSPMTAVIGVGGVFTAADAHALLSAGATLVQVWTGFVYEGPSIVRRINRGLLRLRH